MIDATLFFSHHVFFCQNKRPDGHERGCCIDRGSASLRDYMKKRVDELGIPKTRINASGCLDRCEHGPCLVIYPEGTWYSPRTKEDVEEIIQTHLIRGGRVEQLLLDIS